MPQPSIHSPSLRNYLRTDEVASRAISAPRHGPWKGSQLVDKPASDCESIKALAVPRSGTRSTREAPRACHGSQPSIHSPSLRNYLRTDEVASRAISAPRHGPWKGRGKEEVH
jgi:hypothetical protein